MWWQDVKIEQRGVAEHGQYQSGFCSRGSSGEKTNSYGDINLISKPRRFVLKHTTIIFRKLSTFLSEPISTHHTSIATMALTTTKASEELQALQDRNSQRLAKQGAGNAGVAFAKDVKQSLLFQYDWGELLSAAPMCLSLMGACYVAATSPKATGMTLEDCKPAQGFEFIRYAYQRNL